MVIDLASPRTSVWALLEVKDSPVQGFGFTWQSILYGLAKRISHFRWDSGGRFTFFQEGWELPDDSKFLPRSFNNALDRFPSAYAVLSEK